MGDQLYSQLNSISYASSTRQSDILFNIHDRSERGGGSQNIPSFISTRNRLNTLNPDANKIFGRQDVSMFSDYNSSRMPGTEENKLESRTRIKVA